MDSHSVKNQNRSGSKLLNYMFTAQPDILMAIESDRNCTCKAGPLCEPWTVLSLETVFNFKNMAFIFQI